MMSGEKLEDLSSKRVLIVDDDENNCLILETLLKRAGVGKVEAVHSGLEGLAALESSDKVCKKAAYDVVILDVMLPRTNGFELCVRMRDAWGKDLVIILVTGYNVEDYHARYIESGADDFLSKPIRSAELISRLCMHLRKRRTVEETRMVVPNPNWPDLVVETIGEYSIVKALSWAGPVVSYEGVRDGQKCVVKVLTKQAMEYEDVRKRFLRERDLLASFDHPNITRNLGAGTFSGMDYFVNEFVEGHSLSSYARRRRSIDLDFIFGVARQISDALDYVHRKGVIHRDLKLRNIFVDDCGTVKLGDFGIALVKGDVRLTQSGYSIGTPLYMAPEQAQRSEITAATDVYSFGANMYHLSMGVPPFSAGNAMEILRKHATESPRPMTRGRVSNPEAWNDLIVNRCMAKKPEDRPESMAVVRDEIVAISKSFAKTT